MTIVTYRVTPELKGRVIGVRTIQDRGRVQIPKVIREKLQLKDSDEVYWIESNGKFYIIKAVEIS